MGFWSYCCSKPEVYSWSGGLAQFDRAAQNGLPPVQGSDASRWVINEGDWISLSGRYGIRSDGTLWYFAGSFGDDRSVVEARGTGKRYRLERELFNSTDPRFPSLGAMQVGRDSDWQSVVDVSPVGTTALLKSDGSLWAVGSGGWLGTGMNCLYRAPDSGNWHPQSLNPSQAAFRARISSPIKSIEVLDGGLFSKKPFIQLVGRQNPGLDYIPNNAQSSPVDQGSGAVLEAIWSGRIATPVVTNPGEGYTSVPTVVVTASEPPPGEPPDQDEGLLVVVSGMSLAPVASFSAVTTGQGYTQATATEFYTGATAVGQIDSSGRVVGWTLADPGIPGISPLRTPQVTVTGDGEGASATATNGPCGITALSVQNNPACWKRPPILQIVGGGGSGAEAYVPRVEGPVSGVTVINGGNGYTNGGSVGMYIDTFLLCPAAVPQASDTLASMNLDQQGRWKVIGKVHLSGGPVISIDGLPSGRVLGENASFGSSGEVKPFTLHLRPPEKDEEWTQYTNVFSLFPNVFCPGPIALHSAELVGPEGRVVPLDVGKGDEITLHSPESGFSERPIIRAYAKQDTEHEWYQSRVTSQWTETVDTVQQGPCESDAVMDVYKIVHQPVPFFLSSGFTVTGPRGASASYATVDGRASLSSASMPSSNYRVIPQGVADPSPTAQPFVRPAAASGVQVFGGPIGYGEIGIPDSAWTPPHVPDQMIIYGAQEEDSSGCSFAIAVSSPEVGVSERGNEGSVGFRQATLQSGGSGFTAEPPLVFSVNNRIYPVRVGDRYFKSIGFDGLRFLAVGVDGKAHWWSGFTGLPHSRRSRISEVGRGAKLKIEPETLKTPYGAIACRTIIDRPANGEDAAGFYRLAEQATYTSHTQTDFAFNSPYTTWRLGPLWDDGFPLDAGPASYAFPRPIPASYSSSPTGGEQVEYYSLGVNEHWLGNGYASPPKVSYLHIDDATEGLKLSAELAGPSQFDRVSGGALVDTDGKAWAMGLGQIWPAEKLTPVGQISVTHEWTQNGYTVEAETNGYQVVVQKQVHLALTSPGLYTKEQATPVDLTATDSLDPFPYHKWSVSKSIERWQCGDSEGPIKEQTQTISVSIADADGPKDRFKERYPSIRVDSEGRTLPLFFDYWFRFVPSRRLATEDTVYELDVPWNSNVEFDELPTVEQFEAVASPLVPLFQGRSVATVSAASFVIGSGGGLFIGLNSGFYRAILSDGSPAVAHVTSNRFGSGYNNEYRYEVSSGWSYDLTTEGIDSYSNTWARKNEDSSLWVLPYPAPQDAYFPGISETPPAGAGNTEIVLNSIGSGYEGPVMATVPSPDGAARISSRIDGTVVAVAVIDGGRGYESPPAITVSPPAAGGTTAQLEAVIFGGVDSVSVTNGGSGYKAPPEVRFSQPGISAKAVAVLTGDAVSGVEIVDGGEYRQPPSVYFEPTGHVERVEVNLSGGMYSSRPTVFLAGGCGDGATAECYIDGRISGIEILSEGAGYWPTVSLGGGGGSGATANVVGIEPTSGAITGVMVSSGGSGYTSPPTVVFQAPNGGASAVGVATVFNGQVTGVTVVFGGSRYLPAVALLGGGQLPNGLRAEASVAVNPFNGSISGISIGNRGSLYQSAPSVTLVGGVGVGARMRAFIQGPVDSVQVTNHGRGYEKPPTVIFSGGGGVGATATAIVERVGGGAAATATISGTIHYVKIINGGSGYQRSPSVTVAAPTNAAIRASLQLLNAGLISQSEHDAAVAAASSPARVQARIAGQVDGITVHSGGEAYGGGTFGSKSTTVSFDGLDGSQRTSVASAQPGGLINGQQIGGPIKEVPLPSGSYWVAPEVNPSDGATCEASVSAKTGAHSLLLADPKDAIKRVPGPFYVPNWTVRTEARSSTNYHFYSIAGENYPYSLSITGRIQDIRMGGSFSPTNMLWHVKYDESLPLPQVFVEDVSGSGATAHLEKISGVYRLVFDSPGDGYTIGARAVYRGGTPLCWTRPASVSCEVSNDGRIIGLVIEDPGEGYSMFNPPAIYFSGGGTGASARVLTYNSSGGIAEVSILERGSGYRPGTIAFVVDAEGPSHRNRDGQAAESGSAPILFDCLPECAKGRSVRQESITKYPSPLTADMWPYPQWKILQHFWDGYVEHVYYNKTGVGNPIPSWQSVKFTATSETGGGADASVLPVQWSEVYSDGIAKKQTET